MIWRRSDQSRECKTSENVIHIDSVPLAAKLTVYIPIPSILVVIDIRLDFAPVSSGEDLHRVGDWRRSSAPQRVVSLVSAKVNRFWIALCGLGSAESR